MFHMPTTKSSGTTACECKANAHCIAWLWFRHRQHPRERLGLVLRHLCTLFSVYVFIFDTGSHWTWTVCVCKTCYVRVIIKVYHLEIMLHWIRSVTSQATCAERICQDSNLLLCCINAFNSLVFKKKKSVINNLSTEKAVHGISPIQKRQYEQYVIL